MVVVGEKCSLKGMINQPPLLPLSPRWPALVTGQGTG